MKVKVRRPSPAMCVACIALFVALGGTSVAAVSFARNAGKVDGKDAVAAGTSLSRAAGEVVATERRGRDKGRIPSKFLADVAGALSFGRAFEVVDNATGAQQPVASVSGIGTLSVTCADQSAKPGVEDPISNVSFANQSGQTINVTQTKGVEPSAILALANATVASLTIGGSNTFEYQIQTGGGSSVLVNGTVRQDGRGQPAAFCLVYGTVLRTEL